MVRAHTARGRVVDPRVQAARLAAALFGLAALVMAATAWFVPVPADRWPVFFCGLESAIAAGLLPFLPWQRWPTWMPLAVVPTSAWLELAVGASFIDGGSGTYYAGLHGLTYVWLGLTQRRGVPLLCLPFATLTFWVANANFDGDRVLWTVATMPVWVVVGELLAYATQGQRAAERRLEMQLASSTQQAMTDPLTGLNNRRMFDAALARLAPGDAVVIIDLDHFKRVNDEHGHPAGDTTLRQLAEVLTAGVRLHIDVVCRFGGEEFAMLLLGAGQVGALRAVSVLRDRWKADVRLTTFSAGVAEMRLGDTPDVVARRADAALYEAKRLGRDRVQGADDRPARPSSVAFGRDAVAEHVAEGQG